ncbi:MAG TPA: hypothetical protein VFT55_06785 [Planctomycetota bacterium]|nr:hypothetical protein [Planctomycetota bacterium]
MNWLWKWLDHVPYGLRMPLAIGALLAVMIIAATLLYWALQINVCFWMFLTALVGVASLNSFLAARNRWRGWLVGWAGDRDEVWHLVYGEYHEGAWSYLCFALTGDPGPRVVFLGDERAWKELPEWARSRRRVILERITSRSRAGETCVESAPAGCEPWFAIGSF